PSVERGNGVITVFVRGDSNLDLSTVDLSTLTLTATPSSGTAKTITLRRTPKVEAEAQDGGSMMVLKFSRSQLKGLTGTVTIDVQSAAPAGSIPTGGTPTGSTDTGGTTGTTTTTTTDLGSDTINIFQPGGKDRKHGPKQEHGNGQGASQQAVGQGGHG